MLGELLETLTSFSDPNVALPVVDFDNEAAFYQFAENVGRLLHNYLASVKTLVDHSRNVVKDLWPERPGFRKQEYEPRLRRLFGEPEPVFLQKLRVHYRRLPLSEDAQRRGWDSETARHACVMASLQQHLDRLNKPDVPDARA